MMNRRVSPALVRSLHRWLGLAFSLTVFMSAGSGVIHILMSRTQAPPPSVRPGGGGLDPSRIVVPLAEAVAALPGSTKVVQAANVRQIAGAPWYQIYLKGAARPFYVNAETGAPDEAADERYAAQIAAEFAGGASLSKTDFLTKFNAEYVNIFRVLPVYRLDAVDGLGTRLYVSTTTGTVTRHTDDARQREAFVFSMFHKWMFIPGKDARDAAMVFVNVGVITASAMGVALFFVTRPRKRRPAA